MISYAQHLDSVNCKRIENQRWLYDYYSGKEDAVIGYLEDALGLVYDTQDIQEFIKDWINTTEKLINQSAIVYHEPPKRKILTGDKVNDKLTEYYNGLLPSNTKPKTAQRYAKLLDTSLTKIYFKEGKANYVVLPSHYYNVSCSDTDPMKPEMISYAKDFMIDGKWQIFQVFWTADEHFMIHVVEYSDGKYVYDGGKLPVPVPQGTAPNTKMINPYKILPFATLRLREGSEFWGEGQTDVVTVNEIVNVLLTGLLNNDIILASRGFPVFTNTKKGSVQENIRWGIRHPLIIEQGGDKDAKVEFFYANPQIAEIRETVDWKIRQIGMLKGLDPNKYLADVKATSGFSKVMDSLEQIEIRRDDIEPCREYEDECFNIIRAINNTLIGTTEGKGLVKIPDEAFLQVDFPEIKMPMTAEEKQKDNDWKLSKNLINILDLAKQENPDIEDDKLKEQIIENKKINDELLSRPQIEENPEEEIAEATKL